MGRGTENLIFFSHSTVMDLRNLTYAQIKEILKPWANSKKAAIASRYQLLLQYSNMTAKEPV